MAKPAARLTDPTSCPMPGHGPKAIASGSPDVFFDGLAAARMGDTCTCGSALAMGTTGNGDWQWGQIYLTPRNPKQINLSPLLRWPTPVASMAKGSSPAALTRRSGADRSNDRLDHAVMALDGGHLNPEWTEWLMGWPIGWTDLKPLTMDRFQLWLRAHSKCYLLPDQEAA